MLRLRHQRNPDQDETTSTIKKKKENGITGKEENREQKINLQPQGTEGGFAGPQDSTGGVRADLPPKRKKVV